MGCMSSISMLLTLILLGAAVSSAEEPIYVYNQQPLSRAGDAFVLSGGSGAIIAVKMILPQPFALIDILSYIIFENVTFSRDVTAGDDYAKDEPCSGLVEVVIIEVIAGREQNVTCCTPDVSKFHGCEIGQVYMPSAKNLQVIRVHFRANSAYARMKNRRAYFNETGIYNLFFVSCDPALKGLKVSGKTIWKNECDVCLPGEVHSLRYFSVFMMIAYIFLFFVSNICELQFQSDLIVPTVLSGLLGMIAWEKLCKNFDATVYGSKNNLKTWILSISWLTVVLASIRKTLLRLLILSIAKGSRFSLVRSGLAGFAVMFFGVIYFSFYMWMEMAEYERSPYDNVFLPYVVLILDLGLSLWIYKSLRNTMDPLQRRINNVQGDIYCKFLLVLAVTFVAHVVLWCIEVCGMVTTSQLCCAFYLM
ncbi:OLC1v1002423C1 [Oldenlandia corymbosa var. corymbosa]|uniref:OLC1v1002423C1 n=1 Tax=Oldenlandia corymbosa var. corymbosa TaxID=529605 RepID=A0AAV1D7L2_OLDCO|nr:OLC1v1002423C1 [Oldenlandia corymbosa var. corymbosa]